MKKIASILFIFLFFSFFLVNSVEARSGCCSHHGGVCGCGCCDGTPLSATCAPYYPSCNSNSVEPEYIEEANAVEERVNEVPVYKAAAVMSSVEANNSNVVNPVVENNQIDNTELKEIAPLTEEPEPVLNSQDAVKTENIIKAEQVPLVPVSENKTNQSDDNGFLGGLVFWGVVGYIIYLVKKKRDKKNNNN